MLNKIETPEVTRAGYDVGVNMRWCISRVVLLLIAVVGIPACDGGSGSGGGGGGTVGVFIVSGTATYEKKGIDAGTSTLTAVLTNTPIPDALVRVILTVNGGTLAEGKTDASGAFTLDVSETWRGASMLVRVFSDSSVAYADVKVKNHSGGAYFAQAGPITGPQADMALLATAADATGRVGGAFNIYSQFMAGIEFIRAADPGATFPALEAHWTKDNGTGPPACTCFDQSSGFLIGFLDLPTDTDDYDDSVILHEFAHYLEVVFSHPSSPGGSHFSCGDPTPQDLDYRLSFGEGWGDAFPQMVLGNPLYVDTMPGGGFTTNLEVPCLVTGPGYEDAVASAFWDLFDGPTSGVASTDPDALDLGFGPIWQAMKDLRPVNHTWVADFRDALIAAGSIVLAQWDAEFGFVGLGSPLPAFPGTDLLLNTPTMGAVDASLGQGTLMVSNAFYRLVIPATGTLNLTLTIADPVTNDLDLYLYEDPNPSSPPGSLLAFSNGTTGLETISIFMAPGEYLVQVNAYFGKVGSAAAGFTINAGF